MSFARTNIASFRIKSITVTVHRFNCSSSLKEQHLFSFDHMPTNKYVKSAKANYIDKKIQSNTRYLCKTKLGLRIYIQYSLRKYLFFFLKLYTNQALKQ